MRCPYCGDDIRNFVNAAKKKMVGVDGQVIVIACPNEECGVVLGVLQAR